VHQHSSATRKHLGTNLRSEKFENSDSDSDDDDTLGSFRWMCSFLRDKRRFAWALLSILKNNLVSAPLYYFLLILDYLELLFLFFIFCFTYFMQKWEAAIFE